MILTPKKAFFGVFLLGISVSENYIIQVKIM